MHLRQISSSIFVAIAILTGLVLYNTMNNESRQVFAKSFPPSDHPLWSLDELAERFAGAIRYKTISFQDREKIDTEEFVQLHLYIEQLFPLLHKQLTLHKLGNQNLSLLYEWKGSFHGTEADKPIILCSHLDVVPIPQSTFDLWSVHPFSGTIKDGFIWGRGTIDDKQGVFAILEAAEWLLHQGHQPNHTLYFAFGHDEEISGYYGAKYIAEWFLSRDIKVEYLVDEGLTIFKDSPFPVDEVAIIGLAEKGSVSAELSVSHKGGHASLSVEETAIDILAKAVTKIHENPMPIQFDSTTPFHKALEFLGPEISNYILRAIFSNLWLFDPLLSHALSLQSLTLVNMRTTSATTVISGGTKVNVLPTLATALINHRIVPGDTIESVLEHDRKVINDPRVEVKARDPLEPSPVSSELSEGFSIISQSIRETFVGLPVIPSLFIANSDTRYYWDVAKDIYRFCPTIMTPSDLPRFHGIDERIVENYFKIIQFYYQLIQNHSQV